MKDITKVGDITPDFNNGDKVRDRVTGLEGIIVCTTIWMNGCIRYSVQSQTVKDGKPADATGFDQGDLILVEANALNAKPVKKEGGPQRGEETINRR